jgi:hypothetical protein
MKTYFVFCDARLLHPVPFGVVEKGAVFVEDVEIVNCHCELGIKLKGMKILNVLLCVHFAQLPPQEFKLKTVEL